jgi:hypothetical protein
MRYAEEVELVEEEMRRVLQFLEWRAGWWRSLIGLREGLQPEAALREGHLAYAWKQAAYMDGLAARFRKTWKDVPDYLARARKDYAVLGPDDEDDAGEATDDAGEHADTAWLSD